MAKNGHKSETRRAQTLKAAKRGERNVSVVGKRRALKNAEATANRLRRKEEERR